MSGNETESKTAFSEREMQMLSWAMQSLKTPPEIDYEKLAAFAGMSNPRSASNAWAKIKSKLFANQPDGAPAATPKRVRTKKVAAGQDGDETPTKPKATPRKRAAKADAGDGNESPTKKRTVKPKAKAADTEPAVKAEKTESADEEDADEEDADSEAATEEAAKMDEMAEV